MLSKLIGKLSHQRRTRISLEIRETNLAAQLFFKNSGFVCVSLLKDHYDDTTEDAYVMHYNCHATPQASTTNRITRLAG
jgi:ribosomal-protein-alanine N-acetyltransferase